MPVAKSPAACGRKRNCPAFSFSKAAGKRGSKKPDEKNAQRSTPKIQCRSFTIEPIGCCTLGVGRRALVLKMQFVWRSVAFIIGAIFIYAGAIKALDPVQFANDIDNYKILPWTVGVALAFYLPWLEMFCGIALIFRLFYGGALAVLTGLTCVFLVATVAAKVLGHASQNWSFPAHLTVDLTILAALVALSLSARAMDYLPSQAWR